MSTCIVLCEVNGSILTREKIDVLHGSYVPGKWNNSHTEKMPPHEGMCELHDPMTFQPTENIHVHMIVLCEVIKLFKCQPTENKDIHMAAMF